VSLPLLYAGVRKSEREARARDLLAKVGLERYPRYMPNQISGTAARSYRARAGESSR
jgi:putative ABC transport system ATP-binding protein